jgi:hypothetical protein
MVLKQFFDSPENRTGLSIWIGTALTAVTQYFWLHVPLPSADILGIILGLIKIIQPENTVTVELLQKTIADVSVMITEKTPGAINAVVADAESIVGGVVQEAPKA